MSVKWWAAALALGLAGCRSACGPEDEERRAGYPSEVSACARPSDTGRYCGYYVGGGSAHKGDEPGPEEGTWGWDYDGLHLPSRVRLLWHHGRKGQGGEGAYKVDGPRPLEKVKERLHHEE